MSDDDRPLSPHLQVYRWQITMVLSILHRATGIALAVGLLLLVLWVVAAATGPEAHTNMRELLATRLGLIVLTGLTFALFFHLCNGVRHLFWDAGMGFEKNQYVASGWAVVAGSIVLTLVALLVGGLS